MKNILGLILASLVLFTSCKKDKGTDKPEILNATSVEEIQKAILDGYWQLEKIGESKSSLQDADYYDVFKVLNNKEYQQFYKKSSQGEKNLYKIQIVDGKTAWVNFEMRETAYEENDFSDDDVYYVALENGKLVFTYKAFPEVTVYKKYKSKEETKDFADRYQ